MLGGLVLLLALTFITEAFTASPLKQSGEAAILAQQDIDGILKNAEIVEALGMRKALQRHWGVFHEQSLGKASQASERATGIGALARFVRMALGLLTTGAGAWYAIHDELTIGAMAATSILASRGMAPVETLIGAWKNLVGTRAAVGRINLFLAAKPPNINGTKLPKPKGNIAIERLVYCPPESSLPTIKGINLFLPAGALLGVIGPSGAGKSTLLKLICGVWQPQSGHVRLDGADVSTWHRQDLGQYCGYLPQDIELFSGTVRDNIARFNNRTEIDDTKIIAAAENAGVHELILGLPRGYDTHLNTGGMSLSAGQRQRIGLARALLCDPQLIILDEPNSNLDTDGELALTKAIDRAKARGATIIMVSHRPSLLANADLIAFLKDGELRQYGPKDEVFSKLQPNTAPQKISEVRHGRA